MCDWRQTVEGPESRFYMREQQPHPVSKTVITNPKIYFRKNHGAAYYPALSVSVSSAVRRLVQRGAVCVVSSGGSDRGVMAFAKSGLSRRRGGFEGRVEGKLGGGVQPKAIPCSQRKSDRRDARCQHRSVYFYGIFPTRHVWSSLAIHYRTCYLLLHIPCRCLLLNRGSVMLDVIPLRNPS
jgi:hypothetical protein